MFCNALAAHGSSTVKRLSFGPLRPDDERKLIIDGKARGGWIDCQGRIGRSNTREPGERPDGRPLAPSWLRHYKHHERTIKRGLCEFVPELAKFAHEFAEPLPLAVEPARPTGNAVVERFIRTLKEELIWLRDWESADELRAAIAVWLQHYLHHRPHQALNWQTPIERRNEKLAAIAAAAVLAA